MNSEKKIIFVDMDDTLLTTDKKICSENVEAINRMVLEGHIFAINTGRPLNAVKKLVTGLNMNKNCYILSFHGTNVYDCENDKIIHADSMDALASIKILKAIDDEGIHSQTFTIDRIYTTKDDDVLKEYNKYSDEPYKIVDDYDELKGLALHKIMAIDFNDHGRLVKFQEKYASETSKNFSTFFSCPEYLEYTMKGADKGNGVRFLSDYLGIPISNTIACGDERNDISMLKAAGLGVAMINGNEEAKRAADYITRNNNNNGGIAEVINKFILKTE